MPPLDAPLPRLLLQTAAGSAPLSLDELVSGGPAALAVLADDVDREERLAMLAELADAVSVAVVSAHDHPVGRAVQASGTAPWLVDPHGDLFAALGLETRRLGRRRRRSGVFVVDRGRVLRLAFASGGAGQWITASVVRSRIERLHASDRALRVAPRPAAAPSQRDDTAAGEVPQFVAEDEMGRLVREVGRRLGLTREALADLASATTLRDLGMATVPDEIVSKAMPLDDEEWALVREHPNRSAAMLGPSWALAPVREIVRATHEHFDGSGYPNGLAGEEIPLAARIIFAAESYLAVRDEEPLRRELGMPDAAQELRALSGTAYDPEVVEALLEIVGRRDEIRAAA